MTNDSFSAPIQFKHSFEDGKRKVDGMFMLSNDYVHCQFESKSLKSVEIELIEAVEVNAANKKMRLNLTAGKKLNITFIGPQALDNLALAKRFILEEISKKKKKKQQPTKDLARKRAIVLSQDSHLRFSFDELVKKHKAVEYEEFWNDYEKKNPKYYSDQVGLDNTTNFDSIQNVFIEKFEVHKLFEDMQHEGNMVNMKLSSKKKHLIFMNMPHVRNAYMNQVPQKMTEKEFWSKFLKTEYFRQDKFNVSSADTEIDRLFRSYLTNTGEPARKKRKLNPRVELSASEFVNTAHSQNERGLTDEKKLDLLNKVNHNSEALVDNVIRPDDEEGRKSYWKKLAEDTEIKDLALKEKSDDFIPLNNVQHEFVKRSENLRKKDQNSVKQACQWIAQEMITKRLNGLRNGSERQVWNILNREMRTFNERMQPRSGRTNNFQNPEHERKIIEFHFIVHELLRHFWGCFPLTKASGVRLQKLTPKLQHFRQQVKTFLQKNHGRRDQNMTTLNHMLDKAEKKRKSVM